MLISIRMTGHESDDILHIFNPFLHKYAFYSTSVGLDQPAHSCRLIRICNVHLLVRNNLINQKANYAYISMLSDQDLHWLLLVRNNLNWMQ
jgi:hypothetical protein